MVQFKRERLNNLELLMLNEINNYRASHGGLPPYANHESLAGVARTHLFTLLHTGCRQLCLTYHPPTPPPPDGGPCHTCPGKPNPGQRISNAGISYSAAGENFGMQSNPSQTPENLVVAVFNAWMSEGSGGGHYRNVMSTAYKYVGIGVVIDTDHSVWVTTDFIG